MEESSSSFEFTMPDGDAYRPEGVPLLFRTDLKGNEDELSFFRDLAYEGEPNEVLQNFRQKGNEFMREYPSIDPEDRAKQRKCLEEAIKYYSQALTIKEADANEKAHCLSNRAYALMLYGTPVSLRNAKLDAFECIKQNPNHQRGLLRALQVCSETNDPDGICAALQHIVRASGDVTIPVSIERAAIAVLKSYLPSSTPSVALTLLKAHVKVEKAPVPISNSVIPIAAPSADNSSLLKAYKTKKRLADMHIPVQIIRIDTGTIDLINGVKATVPIGEILRTIGFKTATVKYLPNWICSCRRPAMECSCWRNVKLAAALVDILHMSGFSLEPTHGVAMLYITDYE